MFLSKADRQKRSGSKQSGRRLKRSRRGGASKATESDGDDGDDEVDGGGSISALPRSQSVSSRRRVRVRVPKKAGPRDVAKSKYRGLKLSRSEREQLGLEGAFSLEERPSVKVRQLNSKRDSSATRSALFGAKMGPRECRRESASMKYDGLKLSEEEERRLGLGPEDPDNAHFLEEALSVQTRKSLQREKGPLFGLKKGPQQIGKLKYRGTVLSAAEREELAHGALLSDTVHHSVKKRKRRQHRRARSLLGSKPGPVELGKNRYAGTTMPTEPDHGDDGGIGAAIDMLTEKTHIITKKKWHRMMAPNTADFERAEPRPAAVPMDKTRGTESESEDAPKSKNRKSLRNRKSTKSLNRLKGSKSLRKSDRNQTASTLKRTQSFSSISPCSASPNRSGSDDAAKFPATTSRRKKSRKKNRNSKRDSVSLYRRRWKKRVSSSMGDGRRYQFEYDSDAEYIETQKRNMFDESDAEPMDDGDADGGAHFHFHSHSDSKRNSLVLAQSQSASPKKGAMMATATSLEIAHFVHHRDESTDSETANVSDQSLGASSSLNALSDDAHSDDIDVDDDDDEEEAAATKKRWI